MGGKFSDFPYFVLQNFSQSALSTYSGTMDSYLRGNLSMIVAPIYWLDLYIEGEAGGLVGHTFHIISVEGNIFEFEYGEQISAGSATIEAGSRVFVRKDSKIHSYVNHYTDDIGNYVNTGKIFAYLGEISQTGSNYLITVRGLRDFVMEALPINNRTTNMDEFLNVCFDKVYNEIYGSQKKVSSLQDAKEVDISYLNYLAEAYGMPIDVLSTYVTDFTKREWVDTIIYFLKRKGTYSAIYIIWKVFLQNTLNTMKIYEMWHDSGVTGIPEGEFYEIPFENYYGVAPSGCVNLDDAPSSYYDQIAPSGYPYWPSTDGEPFTTTTVLTPSGMVLSPHYKVEVDFSCEPLGDTYIVNEDIMNDLLVGWNYTKPVSKFAHYQQLISPDGDFSDLYVSLYGGGYNAHLSTKFVGSVYVSAGDVSDLRLIPGAVYQEVASDVWDIYHELDSSTVITQIYDDGKKMIKPDSIKISNSGRVRVEFDTSVRGYAFSSLATAAESGYTHVETPAASAWSINHSLGTERVIMQAYDDNDEMIIPESATYVDVNNATMTWGPSAVSGKVLVKVPDYEHDNSGTESTSWSITHNLNAAGVIAQFCDSEGRMIPNEFTIVDADSCTATWSEAVSGWVLIDTIVRDWSQSAVMAGIDNWKVGTGGSLTYNPTITNDLESVAESGATVTSYADASYYYIDFTVPENIGDLEITELALFNTNNNILFYTTCSPFHKPNEMEMVVHFRISKSE